MKIARVGYVLAFCLAAAGASALAAVTAQALHDISVARGLAAKEQREAPYPVSLKGDQLKRQALMDLDLMNEGIFADRDTRTSILVTPIEMVERDGVWVVSGRLRDPAGAVRQLSIVLDVFMAGNRFAGSSVSKIQSAPYGYVSFSVPLDLGSPPDKVALRLLDQAGRELTYVTAGRKDTEVDRRKIILSDDLAEVGQRTEMFKRLKFLGYFPPDVKGVETDATLLSVVNRFRADHGLQKAGLVDVESFLMIRIVTPDFRNDRGF